MCIHLQLAITEYKCLNFRFYNPVPSRKFAIKTPMYWGGTRHSVVEWVQGGGYYATRELGIVITWLIVT